MGRRKGTSATYIHTHMHTYGVPAPEALEPEGRRLGGGTAPRLVSGPAADDGVL